MTAIICRVLLVAILSLTLTGSIAAQTTATLSGSIVDASGALLPGVQITVRQRTTGFTRSTITAADGRFVVAGLSAGPYEVRAELSGFRPASRADIVVTVGEALTLPPITLEVGGVQEAVTVTSSVTRVNTQTSELSYLVGEQAIAIAAAQRPQLHRPRAAAAGRHRLSVARRRLGGRARPRDERQRTGLPLERLPARRHAAERLHERAGRQRGRHGARHRIDPGVPRRSPTPTAPSSAATSAARSTC